MMAFRFNDEQTAILDHLHYRDSQILAVNALAGTGKTTTLKGAAQYPLKSERLRYFVFNKRNADEAAAEFPNNTTTSSAHSFLSVRRTRTAAGPCRKCMPPVSLACSAADHTKGDAPEDDGKGPNHEQKLRQGDPGGNQDFPGRVFFSVHIAHGFISYNAAQAATIAHAGSRRSTKPSAPVIPRP